jgi:hypothetical protein
LPFDAQVQTIGQDLREHFWHEGARVVCNSFGAYLFLHAQAQMDAFIGRVLLLSPIVGEFSNEQAQLSFSPPRPTRLRVLAEAGITSLVFASARVASSKTAVRAVRNGSLE